MGEVKNIYKDEQKRIEADEFMENLLKAEIQDLLNEYGYNLVAELEYGMPTVNLVKRL